MNTEHSVDNKEKKLSRSNIASLHKISNKIGRIINIERSPNQNYANSKDSVSPSFSRLSHFTQIQNDKFSPKLIDLEF